MRPCERNDAAVPDPEQVRSALGRPIGPVTSTLRAGLHLTLRGFLRTYHRFRVRGAENLPADRSFVLVCNHTSHLDALCILSSLPLESVQRAFPAAAADYFFSSLPRAFLSSIFVNGLPFDRQGGGAESVALCAQLLAGDRHVLILFPEGTRSVSGELQRFRAGVGRLVVGTTIPVVPCYLDGAHAAWPKGARFPRPRRLELRVGAPRTFEQVEAGRPGAVRRVCRELEQAVLGLARPTSPDRPSALEVDPRRSSAGV